MRSTVLQIRECPPGLIERERGRAIDALASAYRHELELAERFDAIGEGETVSPEEVDRAIDARQFAEALLGEWS
jgi:hypothetical protein